MKTHAQKWGHSLAIRIPKVLVQEIGLRPGAEVELEMKTDQLVITPLRKKRYKLRSLLARVQKSNKHSETDWGQPMGREAW